MNKFAQWMRSNDKKQRGVAEKLEISTSTLHDILRNGQIPNLPLAYRIEVYTQGIVTLYDWIDKPYKNATKKISPLIPAKTKRKTKKTKT